MHLNLRRPQTFAAHIILNLTRDSPFPLRGEFVLHLKDLLFAVRMHKGVARRTGEAASVVKVPLNVDNFGAGIHDDSFTYVKLEYAWCNPLVSNFHARWLNKGKKVLIVG